MFRLPAFPPLVWVLLLGTLLIRGAYYLVWPFLAVVLYRRFRLSPLDIGAILTGASLAGSALGFYAGNLSDRFGRRHIMIAGALGSAAGFAVLATAVSVSAFVLGACLVGLARPTVESPSNALISDSLDDKHLRELAFHARYFLINVGAAVGPLLGLVFALTAQQVTFWVVCIAYSVYAAVLLLTFRLASVPRTASPSRATLGAALAALKNDRPFLMLMLANFLCLLAFSQFDSTTVQYLNLAAGETIAVPLYTALIITNAVTIILFQFPLLRLLRDYDIFVRAQLGIVLFAVAFLIYAVMPVTNFAGWIVATWILSMGEAILFPTMNMQIDRMAPAHLRGTYFGASLLGSLGFSFGPLLGGTLLRYAGGPPTFVTTVFIVIVGGFCYWLSARLCAAAIVRRAET